MVEKHVVIRALNDIKTVCKLSNCSECPFSNIVNNIPTYCPFDDVPEDWEIDEL